MLSSKKDKNEDAVDRSDIQHYFKRLDKKFNKQRKQYDQQVEEVFREFTTYKRENGAAVPAT